MGKLIDYKTFKDLCDTAKIKGINLKECGLGDIEAAAYTSKNRGNLLWQQTPHEVSAQSGPDCD